MAKVMRKAVKFSGAKPQRSGVVKGHQKDLAKVAGETAYMKKLKKAPKVKNPKGGEKFTTNERTLAKNYRASLKAQKKATKSTMKSFKGSK